MKRSYSLFIFLFFSVIVLPELGAQQADYFTLEDFQLQGPVKRCVVRANYGEETFEFDREGKLLKTRTRYNDEDYNITYYIYRDSLLAERRDEVYREGEFDSQTSMAHIYKQDTLANRKSELIVSYDRSFTEQFDQYYDDSGQLIRLVRTDGDGTDETQVEYTTYRSETTATYSRNGNIVKSIRQSEKNKDGIGLQIELTKEYLQGEPQKAIEVVRDDQGQVLTEKRFRYDTTKASFVPEEMVEWSYDESGFPISESRTPIDPNGKEGEKRVREFIYQMDGSDPPNWVRQITVPENTMVVRSIEYYDPETVLSDADSLRN